MQSLLHQDGWNVPLEEVSDEVAYDGKDCYIGFFFSDLYIPNEVFPEILRGSRRSGGLYPTETGVHYSV